MSGRCAGRGTGSSSRTSRASRLRSRRTAGTGNRRAPRLRRRRRKCSEPAKRGRCERLPSGTLDIAGGCSPGLADEPAQTVRRGAGRLHPLCISRNFPAAGRALRTGFGETADAWSCRSRGTPPPSGRSRRIESNCALARVGDQGGVGAKGAADPALSRFRRCPGAFAPGVHGGAPVRKLLV